MSNRTKLTPKKREKFLAVLEECGNVSKACKSIGISRTCAYDHKNNDPEFHDAWEECWENFLDECEDELVRRAFTGVEKELAYQGKLTGDTITEKSDTLLMFYMKGNRPEKYKDRQEITGKDGGPIQTSGVLAIPQAGDDWEKVARDQQKTLKGVAKGG